jgi:UDP-galactopyranose mutase
VSINYPSDFDYTRSLEVKHVTGQRHPGTVIVREYPRSRGEPFYPIPTAANSRLYERYRVLAEKETKANGVYFCGRLATYSYLNMDAAIERALELFTTIKTNSQFRYALDHRAGL